MINREVKILRITSSREIMSQMPNNETTVINSTKLINMYEVIFFNPFITLFFKLQF